MNLPRNWELAQLCQKLRISGALNPKRPIGAPLIITKKYIIEAVKQKHTKHKHIQNYKK
jgi:hypothetical protein